MLREAGYYSRMTLGVFKLSRMPLEKDPRAAVGHMLANRTQNFLDLMKRVVFADPSNPYYTLFSWAGYSYEDLERAVLRDGLEPTLESLRKAGVYLANDEFKGKKPIVRSGRTLSVQPEQFANPLVRGLLETTSGASRSAGTTTRRSLEFQIYREAQTCALYEGFDLANRPIVGIRGILPSDGGVRMSLTFARRGLRYEKFFALGGSFKSSAHYRIVTNILLLEARLLGVRANFPTYLPHNDFAPVARWLARRRAEGTRPILWAGVSNGVRVAAAAKEEGLDIRGVTFVLGAEALTPAKEDVIESVGGEICARYGISELGQIGVGCPEMKRGNTVHVCRDSLAVISYRKVAPLTDVEIESLMFTTLLPSAAFVFVNVEMDDSGVLEEARCNCGLKAMGFTQQISNIYSYGRLTGQGMTLVGTDMLEILERSLPGRFGGTSTDYQLVECEGKGQTEMELRVHPRVGVTAPEEVRAFFMAEVKRLWGGALTRRNWEHTEGVRVTLAEPYMSRKHRVHSLHLLGTTGQQRQGLDGTPQGPKEEGK